MPLPNDTKRAGAVFLVYKKVIHMVISSGKRMKKEAVEQKERVVPPLSPLAPDVVQEASEQSFPASDAPSWTVVTGTGPRLPQQAANSSKGQNLSVLDDIRLHQPHEA